ncbi:MULTISPECIES: ATP-dependent zinc metalloprotease FtsH [unclassified Clostridioides]|uniref:ATP-dependent zinc metalloprotease FtsH n=1 Tax=unclassified Clostridioides TaxID=2635829 RepID=UPI001D11F6A5|nr:ATP-dependent zinc metalloprotease FtsH [Clostridioides sp. ZZV14-6150]MCC0662006.1 ATP-dependent zinc metalloprotease FtsH [Clostridioides sp. ZZV14-6154]MCC0670159.1 ATP-dependent zinc metalloprotease FtsH [Clostridioides sp. ZZV14-6153]MCC0719131.1 ATP-dependent zinc metalloprotease FtsH [Clostridioides sp. ZZV14-6105]MCC0724437.1 ATP-dependent zinc metalloprotease FtsH [Clostridioides sp. ZZV14-6104]MCC0744645.1 ATP-dependent zinc metalloprotease FtsH [Clostridioides sp. ZZV14-6044]MCC
MNKLLKGAGFYLLVFIIIVGIVQFSGKPTEKIKDLKFSQVYRELTDENISRLYFVNQTSVEGTIKDTNTKFKSYVPTEIMGDKLADEVLDQAKAGKLTFGGEAKPSTPWFVEMLPTLLLIFFMVILWFVFMNQSQGGGGKVMSFGKSKAKVHKDDEKTRVTFKDVAGLDEEKEDLQEVVDFLKNPKKYIELGARIPKGMLMVGPPGTGKTYLSRAVAGEAGVPFFSISGSDFVEMFVGVGASRVRDLFEQAKKSAPAIIFIDEIDAVGRKRGAGLGGGHDEREQTLNQLLVEMDGFGVNQGIIIMAATNRPDILDPALLRPGRFDRQVVVGTPDVKGREAIFKVHSRNKPLNDDVKMDVLARRTPGFTPADIENLMNEAAILTARKREKKIKMETIEEAITKVIAGVAKKSRVISEKERRLTAYHEGGHAVCAHILEEVSPVHQVTIVPRGRAGGFTMQLPVEDKFYATKNEMKENIVVLLGGRVAEELVLKDVSTGASNDLERVTATARSMVTKYGMSSKLGPMSFDSDDEVFLGNSFSSKRNYSEEVAFEIDQETKRIVDGAYDKTRSILQENMDRLEYVAQALLIYETLDADQFIKAFNKELPLNDIENAITEENSPKETEEQLTINLEKDREERNNVVDINKNQENKSDEDK